MKKLLVIIPLFILVNAFGQTQTFDIATFNAPLGWSKEVKDFAASLVKTNNKTGSWCRVTIYKSIKGSGDAVVDFSSEWNSLMVKNNWGTAVAPQPETVTEEGWISKSAVATFQYENKDAYSLLSTVSGYGVVLSVVVLMNSQEFMRDVEKILSSLHLKKPEGEPAMQIQTNTNQQSTTNTATNVSGSNGISISTTNFNDGWVAQPFADYVRVVKGNLEVYLYYVDDFSTQYSGKIEPENHYWNTLIPLRFNTLNASRWNGGVTYPPIYYQEGDAVEKQTGKSCFLGMDVFFSNGGARVILVVAPNKSVFYKTFQHPRDLEKMLVYNKFAVATGDLVGTWEESSGAGIDMYNSVTGAYAGMNTSSSAHKFIFKTADQYESSHKGASGMVGSMKFYDQKYSGKYTVNFWDITVTNRFEGKTDVYWAQFEAVRGGRVLHLTDKTASGMQYHLVKMQ